MHVTLAFEAALDVWQDRYRAALPTTRIGDLRQDAEFLQKRRTLESEYELLLPLADRFVALVLGRERGMNALEQAAGASLCFLPRILNVASVDDLETRWGECVAASLRDTFLLGFMCHLVLFNHPSRSKLESVDLQVLFPEFLADSVSAESKLKPYNRAAHNIPRMVFDVQFNLAERLFKEGFRIGFWKMGKLQSNYYNAFCSGILLPMKTELMANAV